MEQQMAAVYLCIGLCVIIWGVNGNWIRHAVREHIVSEIYIHTAIGLFFTVLALELTLGSADAWSHLGISWLKMVGWLLFLPSIGLVFGSMLELKQKGRPSASDPTYTTSFVDTGLFHFIRQPITLGISVWSLALMMVFQSVLSIVIGLIVIYCCWISARKESEYDILKFGTKYEVYMAAVPMWNIFRGMIKR
jgi:protein-S-isoprenylcysteine O-methyltransferase Ste14